MYLIRNSVFTVTKSMTWMDPWNRYSCLTLLNNPVPPKDHPVLDRSIYVTSGISTLLDNQCDHIRRLHKATASSIRKATSLVGLNRHNRFIVRLWQCISRYKHYVVGKYYFIYIVIMEELRRALSVYIRIYMLKNCYLPISI